MSEFVEKRYSKLGPKVAEAFKSRSFEAYYFDEPAAAAEKIISLIPKDHLVSWGGSMTLKGLGIQERLKKDGYNLLDRDNASTPEERFEIARQALLCDTYLSGSNAVSEDGQLVNIDGYGNRAAAVIFGPKQVIIAAGMNKVAKTLDDAIIRARTMAAPANIQRFPGLKTPCSATGSCADCLSGDTICSFFVTTRFCKPAGRIKIILIGKDLGF
ncbi:MAG: lactate utilization protein [Treponema sp.]|jgi:L-lactate utilization protein LutB|nr:lactate utilization protein [Treponema sp.]